MDKRVIRRVTLIGFSLILGGLFYFQIIKGDYYLVRSKANYIKVIPQDTIRGSILDRNKKLLAYDKPIFNIAVIPYQIRNKKRDLFYELSHFLGVPYNKINSNYNRNVKSFFAPVSIIEDISKEEALRTKERFGDDIIIKEMPFRFYPFSKEVSHILGYVKRAEILYNKLKAYGYTPYQRVGFLGVEQYYDSYLRGKDGGKLVEVDSSGKIVGFLGEQVPQRGIDITLTIDLRMQIAAYKALSEEKGAIILMDPYNGEIFVLCSRPSYDLNKVTKGKGVQNIFRDKRKPFINRTIQATYPLGSVFKPIVAIAGLEEKLISKDTTFNCPGYFIFKDSKFSCWDIHGVQNLIDALVHSCNVYFYNLGLRAGIERIYRWAKKFNFGKKTDIDLPYEKKGIVPNPKWKRKYRKKMWFTGDTINISIGQGYLEVTPLQALVAISAFANGGYIVRPHLLKKIGDEETAFLSKNYLNISSFHLKIIKEGLREAVLRKSGTAHLLYNLSLGIAGKTGTAQTSGKSHGWFVGFFPYRRPRYSICVFLENAGSSYRALKVAYQLLLQFKREGLIKD